MLVLRNGEHEDITAKWFQCFQTTLEDVTPCAPKVLEWCMIQIGDTEQQRTSLTEGVVINLDENALKG